MIRYIAKYILLNIVAPLIPHPKLRSGYLKVLGARIGRTVRIENVRFIQIQGAIANLQCADDVFIGSGVTIDLSAPIKLGSKAIIAPNCSLITHQDFGDFNGSAIAEIYPRKDSPITVGANVVIGCDTTVLAGSVIDPFTVIGAKSLVFGRIPGNALVLGAPARYIRSLKATC